MQKFLLLSADRACKSATKRAKTCTQRVHVPTELPFCMPPLLVGFPPPPLSTAGAAATLSYTRFNLHNFPFLTVLHPLSLPLSSSSSFLRYSIVGRLGAFLGLLCLLKILALLEGDGGVEIDFFLQLLIARLRNLFIFFWQKEGGQVPNCT